MYIKSLVSILIVTSSFIIAIGQDTPAPKKDKDAPKAFSWSFDGGGSYLGVQTQEVNKENFSKFGLREVRGVAVEKVVENSPAAAAGIQAGDVIVRFNGEEITSSRKLTRLIGEVDPDYQARVTVIRNGSEQELNATIGKRAMPKFEEGNFSFAMPPMGKMEMPDLKDLPALPNMPQLRDFPQGDQRTFTFPGGEGQSFAWRAGDGRTIGIGTTQMTKQLASHFGVDGGVMVNDVRENSPAAKAGITAGDIIVEADGKAVKSQFDLIKAINAKKEGSLQLTLVRQGKRQTISVTPEASKDSGFLFQNGEDGVIAPAPASPMMPRRGMASPAVPATPAILAAPGRVM